MAARLAAIPVEGKTVEEVAAEVVGACQEFGVEMRRFDSKKSSKLPGARLTVIGLACKHGMRNRQKEYSAEIAGGVHKTWTLSRKKHRRSPGSASSGVFGARLSFSETTVAEERLLSGDETCATQVPWKRPAG